VAPSAPGDIGRGRGVGVSGRADLGGEKRGDHLAERRLVCGALRHHLASARPRDGISWHLHSADEKVEAQVVKWVAEVPGP
jgi:hypothetical protein